MSDPERPSSPEPPAPAEPSAPPTPPAAPHRKDRLVQTRVPRELESRIKAEAERQRLTVSQLVRNLLEDTVVLVDGVLESVDGIVAESVGFAEDVSRDALRVARAATQSIHRRGADAADPDNLAARPSSERSDESLAHVDAWNPVIMNRSTSCSLCTAPLQRGDRGYAGIGSGSPEWLCTRCIDEL